MQHTIGLGTRQLTGEACYTAIRTALDVGYRHIDGADRYGNAEQIGCAWRESGVAREHLRLTSKVWISCFGSVGYVLSQSHGHGDGTVFSGSTEQSVRQRLESELHHFQTEYLDLVLLHWPTTIEEHHRVVDTLLQLRQEGKIRHIGVSNFSLSQLDDMILYLGQDLYAVQYEYHVCLDQSPALDRCRQHNIQFQAYSPLAHGKLRNDRQTLTVLEQIAQKHQLIVSQVMLSWLLDQQILVLPKSTSLVHLQENFATPRGILDDEDRLRITGFSKHFRYCNPSAIAPNRNA